MRKLLLLLFFILSYFVFLPSSLYAEEIADFRSEITIKKAGTIDIVEQIDYDFGSLSRHGIFRTIPTIKKNQEGKKFRLNFSNFSVTDENGKRYRFSQTSENENIKLKIGDPNTIITGRHTYTISYTVSGALTYFSDHDELYWNVTGTEWSVPIEEARVKVVFPSNIVFSDVTAACYTGGSGSTNKNCTTLVGKGGVTVLTSAPLSLSEGLTIVVGFPKNVVSVLEPKEVVNFFDTGFGRLIFALTVFSLTILSIFWYIIYPIYIVIKWYTLGRDPKTTVGITSASFDPPKTQKLRPLTPGETGALIDEIVDMEDISATVVDLARRGYMKIIEKDKDDFYLQKKKDIKSDKELQQFERAFLDGIFKENDTIRLKDTDLVETVDDVKKMIYATLVFENFFPKNPDDIRKFYTIIGTLALFTINIPLVLVAFIFGRYMPRKTIFGTDQANVAKSLKNFLSSQERQLEFQAKNQMFFEKLLPYAVAFGVEKIWAKRFADIELKQPQWYQGYSGYSFTSTNFVNSLNSSFTSIAHAATPTSSSSGFSSGFSGGSSGGGGGGGGGGSW